VRDNRDPEKLGQLEVEVPSVLGETTRWALPCVPYAGPQVGWFALPPVGANVWVEFEGGDPEHPIWSGCFWGEDELPLSVSGPEVRMFKTEGATLSISGLEQDGLVKGVALKVETPLVEEPLTITLTAEGIEINHNNQATIKLTANEIQLSGQGSLVTLKGESVELKNGQSVQQIASDGIDLKSGTAEIELGASGIDLKNGAQSIQLSAASVSVNNGALEVI
jgi:uncharacterized protein involved in type VI secretion and phage assembly